MHGILREVSLMFSVSAFGIIRAGIQSRHTHYGARLRDAGNGLLITFDEAHRAPASRLAELLDKVREAGREMPVAIVLAGTPGLEDTPRKSGASYWSRGIKLGVAGWIWRKQKR